MKRKIPSTTSLAVFSSAAKHESFTRAAEELCMTESAVSRQITSLETYLGIRLFRRVKQQVVLNDAGRVYLEKIDGHLDEIEQHTASLIAHKGVGDVLEIAVIPTFANAWLMPRLADFCARYPDILLSFSDRPTPFVFQETNFDLALHFDHPSWAGVTKVHLFNEEIVPVISSRHYEENAFSCPADLMSLPLLHKSTRPDAWERWFVLASCEDFRPTAHMRFELYSMVIEAVKAGLGAGLVPRFYVQDEIAKGNLSIPFDIALQEEKKYCVVFPDYKLDSPTVTAFQSWISGMASDFNEVRSGEVSLS